MPRRDAGLRWLIRYPARRWRWVLATLLTMLLQVGLDVLKPWPMKILVDHVLSGKPLPATLAGVAGRLPGGATQESLLRWSVAATVLLFVLGWGVGLVGAVANTGLSQRLTYDLASDLFAHLQRLSLRFHGRKSVGDTVRRVTTDSACVATIVNEAALPVLTALVSLAAMFAVMWSLDPPLTLLAVAVVPYMVFVFRRYAGPMLERSYRQQEVEGRIYDVVEQTLSAIPVVQAFAGEERADRRLRSTTQATLAAVLATTQAQVRFKTLMGLATAGGTAAILWVSAQHVLEGSLSVGGILVFLSYLGSLYSPLESVMYLSSAAQEAGGSARRVREVLDVAPEVRDAPGARPLPPLRGHVLLDDVSFGYDPDRPVLRGVSLELRPGQTLALVGPTGAGKTTLAGLLPRFFDPWTGRVLLDGQDIRKVQLKSLREQVALVLQEPFVLPRTVAENIGYGRPGADRAAIEAAARAANAHAFIARLPQGYDTVVGERGATLSGGERQRIAIARALLKDAPLLILDEPTSALDAETEALVLDALRRLMAGRTTLIIAHRLSTIRDADQIAVLREGRIAEQGTHQELLAREGLYARFYWLQRGPAAAPGPDRPAPARAGG